MYAIPDYVFDPPTVERKIFKTDVANGVCCDEHGEVASKFKVQFDYTEEEGSRSRTDVFVESHEIIEGKCTDKDDLYSAISDFFMGNSRIYL